MKLDRDKIYLLLAKKQWTVTEFCNIAKISSQSFYQYLKSNKTSTRTIGFLSHILGVQPDAIMESESDE